MKFDVSGKKILLVAPVFFGYEQDIKNELQRRGAHVDFVLDRPFKSAFAKGIVKVCRSLLIKVADDYYLKATHDLPVDHYDMIFVVNGQTLSTRVLEAWGRQFPNAVKVLYMWDSFGNRQDVVRNLQYIDHGFTFDQNDALQYGLHFRPLFFSRGFERPVEPPLEWDVSFVGTAHTDRYRVASLVKSRLPETLRVNFYLFLQAQWVFWFYRMTNRTMAGAQLKDFSFSPLDKAQVQQRFSASYAILDIEHPNQTGLTMRTLETLGAKKKLITTNRAVQQYDFYKPENICVIDRRDPVIAPEFFSAPYQDVEPAVYQRYRLEGWMDEILNEVPA